ncbi:MAG: hypothetical protein JWM11_3166 [Planctomycetaceae bacterium]|nr:hypothetical protein [Planctomycetaceae bacterium]
MAQSAGACSGPIPDSMMACSEKAEFRTRFVDPRHRACAGGSTAYALLRLHGIPPNNLISSVKVVALPREGAAGVQQRMSNFEVNWIVMAVQACFCRDVLTGCR